MRQTLIIFWIWGFALVAYVCYGRMQFQSAHLAQKSQYSGFQMQTSSWMPKNKHAD